MDDRPEGRAKLRADGVVWRQVGDEVMVLDTEKSEYLSVNGTGATLWPLLVDGATRGQLTEVLIDQYGVDKQTAEADASNFLASLVERGLLQMDV